MEFQCESLYKVQPKYKTQGGICLYSLVVDFGYSTYPLTGIYLNQTKQFLFDQTSGTLKLTKVKGVEIYPACTNFKAKQL